MARSLVGGLLQNSHNDIRIAVCDPDAQQRQRMQEQFAIEASADMAATIAGADCIVLAVKPQVLRSVCVALGAQISDQVLILSIAAGVETASINRWLASQNAIVRCMPNTPALIQAGASALFATSETSAEQRDLAESIMRAAGTAIWVDSEDQIDAVTALSGSGPAYVFLVIEAMQKAGQALGLNEQQSRLLALQTVFGAAKMALEDNEPVSELRQRVTSKGGTTESALQVFEQGNLIGLFEDAMSAAYNRAKQLATELDKIEE